jgi:predicted Zn-dependent protease
VTASQELVEAALAASEADGCVVLVDERSEVNLRWALNALTTDGAARARTMTVISVEERTDGRATGIASSSVVSAAEAVALVRVADAAARAAPVVEDSAPLVEGGVADTSWGAEVEPAGPEALDPVAAPLGEALARWRATDRLLFGFAEHVASTTFLASSAGLRRRFTQHDARLELTGKSRDLERSAWDGAQAPTFEEIDLGRGLDALERGLGWAARRVELPAARYETILPPSTVADLMLCAYFETSARDADEGRSVFAAPGGGDRLGSQLSPLGLSLYSDPAAPGLECAPFVIAPEDWPGVESVFDNGAPVPRTAWIDGGRLAALVRTRGWAARSGRSPQPFVGNLVLDGGGDGDGGATVEEMIASTERALLLTSLWYIRTVDPETLLVTGLTRDGVYLVEDGKVVAAVNNFRFNESPIDLLERVLEVGAVQRTLPREYSDLFPRTAMAPLRVADFGFSTVSDAR